MNSLLSLDKPSARKLQTGMTLIELLVVLVLLGIVLTAVLNVTLKTNSATSAVQAQTEMVSETQLAQNYIASRLRNAVYIFPASTTVSYFQMASSGYSTYNPTIRAGIAGNGNNSWRLATGNTVSDPFIAFVVPPAGGNTISSGSCLAVTQNASSTEQDKQNNCYVFYAYYAVPRSLLVNGMSGSVPTGPNKLSADPANDASTWVLMEYRGYYTNTGYSTGRNPSTGVVANDGIPGGGTGRIVLDYVMPTTEKNTDKLFIGSASPANVVTINLASTRKVAGTTVNVPATGRYTLNVYPRNLETVAINN